MVDIPCLTCPSAHFVSQLLALGLFSWRGCSISLLPVTEHGPVMWRLGHPTFTASTMSASSSPILSWLVPSASAKPGPSSLR